MLKVLYQTTLRNLKPQSTRTSQQIFRGFHISVRHMYGNINVIYTQGIMGKTIRVYEK